MRMGDSPNGVRSVLADLLKGLNLESRIKEQNLLLIWDEVVGEQVASAAQPEFIRDGRMFVVVKSSVWANELTFLKKDIITRLNRKVSSSVLKDIVFKVGKLPERRLPEPTEKPEPFSLEGIQLTDLELDQVENAAHGAGDEAAEIVKGLMTTAMKLDKWKRANGWVPCKKCGVLQNTREGVCPICRIER